MRAIVLFILINLFSVEIFGQDFAGHMVDHIPNPGSMPEELCLADEKLFFTAHRPSSGRELWCLDLQTQDATLVRDIVPGPESSEPIELISLGDAVVFRCKHSSVEREIWVSDGTFAGTTRLISDSASLGLTAPKYIRPVNRGANFVTTLPNADLAIWYTNGTPEGTEQKLVLEPGESLDGAIAISDGTAVYASRRPAGGVTLRRLGADGIVIQIAQLENLIGTYRHTTVGDDCYFGGEDREHGWGLWRYSFPSNQVAWVQDISPGHTAPIAFRGDLFLQASTPAHGKELWKSDGTTEGTTLVKDIWPGQGDSSPGFLLIVDDVLYFTALTEQHGRELWQTDGTSDGTRMVHDIYQGRTGGSPYDLAELDGKLVFSANHPGFGEEMWIVPAGGRPSLVRDIRPGACHSMPYRTVSTGNHVYFTADDGIHGEELWRSDGTATGTRLVADIGVFATPPPSSNPRNLTAYKDAVFFVATDKRSYKRLWRSEGSPENTIDVTPSFGGPSSVGEFQLVKSDNSLYLFGWNHPGSSTLFSWSENAQQFRPLRELPAHVDVTIGIQASARNDTVFFVSDGTVHGRELSRYDVVRKRNTMYDIAEGPSSSNPSGLWLTPNAVYFAAEDHQHGRELWCIAFEDEHPKLVAGLKPGPPGSYPSDFLNTDSGIYFVADTDSYGFELWLLSSASEKPVLVKDIGPGQDRFYRPRSLTLVGSDVFFVADDGIHGYEVWCTDGTSDGTRLVKDIFSGKSTSNPSELTAFKSLLYFRADDGNSGAELWRSDGTDYGTVRMENIYSQSSSPSNLTVVGDWLVFVAQADTSTLRFVGRELYRSDGIGFLGTSDVWNGEGSSSPAELTLVGETLFFSADDGVHGRELWKMSVAGEFGDAMLVKDIHSPP